MDPGFERDRISWRDEGRLLDHVHPGSRKRSAETQSPRGRPIASTSKTSLTSPVLGFAVTKSTDLRDSKPKGARAQSLALRMRKKQMRRGESVGSEETEVGSELLDDTELRRLAELNRRMQTDTTAPPTRTSARLASRRLQKAPSVQQEPSCTEELDSPPSPSPQPRIVASQSKATEQPLDPAEDSDDLFDDSLDIPLSQLPEVLDQTTDELPSLVYSTASHDTTDDSIASIAPDMRRVALARTATERASLILPAQPVEPDESEPLIELPGPSQSQRALGTSKRRGDGSQETKKLRGRFVPPVPKPDLARKPTVHPEYVALLPSTDGAD